MAKSCSGRWPDLSNRITSVEHSDVAIIPRYLIISIGTVYPHQSTLLLDLSERSPKALVILAGWISSVVTSSAKAIWNVILKTISFLSTVVEAVISFLRSVTLADVWNDFLEVLKAVFVTFPKMTLSWIEAFGKTSYKVMKVPLGMIGEHLWWIGYGVGWVILYIPRQLWKILKSFGESFMKAFYELRVWFDLKAR
jgi:hypothetical protein